MHPVHWLSRYCSPYQNFLVRVCHLHLKSSNKRCHQSTQLSSCESLSYATSWTMQKCEERVITIGASHILNTTMISINLPLRSKGFCILAPQIRITICGPRHNKRDGALGNELSTYHCIVKGDSGRDWKGRKQAQGLIAYSVEIRQ